MNDETAGRARVRLVGVALAALALGACPGVRPADGGLPMEPHDIRGVITTAEPGAILVEEDPTEQWGSPKAHVRLTGETDILRADGERAGTAELRVGLLVRVWFAGPVADSYPLQATAATVVIDGEPVLPPGVPTRASLP